MSENFEGFTCMSTCIKCIKKSFYSFYQWIISRTYMIFLDDDRSKHNTNSYVNGIKRYNKAPYDATRRSERCLIAYADKKEWFNWCESKYKHTNDKRTKQTNGQNDLMPIRNVFQHVRLLSGSEDVKTLLYCTVSDIASFWY